VVGYYIQLALRSLRKTPMLTLLMVITLSVGQASSIIILTLRHALVRDPIPEKSHLLFTPRASSDGGGSYDGMFTYAQAHGISGAYTKSLIMGQALGPISNSDHSKSLGGRPIRFTTRNFFSFFDVPINRGRVWSDDEDLQGVPVAILSYRLAKKFFPTSDPVGAPLEIGGTSFRVVGVINDWDPAPRFYDLSIGSFMLSDDVFLPLGSIRQVSSDMGVPKICDSTASTMPPSRLLDVDCSWLTPWFLAEDAKAVPSLIQRISTSTRLMLSDSGRENIRVLNVQQILSAADLVPSSVTLFTGLGICFLTLCIINSAGMQLSRLMRRVSQIGVRRALGATRRDIVSQYLSETLLIGTCGGVLGLLFTEAGLYWIRQLDSYYTRTACTDLTTAALAVLLIGISCLLTGIVPALVASRADPALVIKSQA
jgi:putative ABC transport system permease protein